VHDVSLVSGSTLAGIYGSASLPVNSLHHQTVDQLGTNLRVTAQVGDTVGGGEHTELPIVAVQWHPEMLDSRSTDPIFTWLVDQAKQTR